MCFVDICNVFGMMSETGYGLCNECTKDQYLVNSTSCTSCPAGQLTRGTGAIDDGLCLSKYP